MKGPLNPHAEHSRSTWLLVCVLLLVLAATTNAGNDRQDGSSEHPDVTDEWRGFRGQERQGVGAATESPTVWSSTQTVRWKTAVQGSGHSSPVISGEHVYVTTAFESGGTKRMLVAARWVRLGLCLVALVLWLMLPPAVTRSQEVVSGALLTAFVVLALADEKMLRFERSASRAWLGAGAASIIGLVISAYGLDRRSWSRRMVGLGLGVAALGLVAGRPTGIDESWALTSALGVVTAAALAGCALVLRGTFPSQPSGRSSILVHVGGRPLLRAAPQVATLWRTCVVFGAALGFVIPVVLVPRSGWVYALACLDRTTGRVLWTTEGFRAAPGAIHSSNSRATPTAVTDGRRVFAYFGSAGLMAVDTSGSLLWTNSGVPFQTIYGVGASPVLAHNTLVLSSFTPAGPYLVAFDANEGREMWRVTRPKVHPEFGDSRTPLVRTIGGRHTVVAWGREEIAGYDLSTGQESWRHAFDTNYQMGSMVSSLVADDDSLYLPLENGIVALGTSNLAAGRDPVVWKSRGGGSALTTPVLYEERIYAVSAVGVASCTDARTGELLWRTRLDGEFHSSPVAAAGKVYFTNESGKTTVVAAAPEYKVLAENELGERVVATIAPLMGDLYVRALNHVYRIGP